MHYISICAIARDENLYLEEWVNFHRAVGIDHFYIYDNGSAIPITETLKKYIKIGIVSVINFPGTKLQFTAYSHFLNNFRKETKWAAVIDCDEFLVPKIKDTVPEILQNYENYGGLVVNWMVFGSGGHISKPDGLMTENFTMASPPDWYYNTHIKSIIQPARVLGVGKDPHHFRYPSPYYAVSENKSVVKQAWNESSTNIIQLNHYFLKSFEEFKIKAARGRADTGTNRDLEEFYNVDKFCNIEDKSALKFVEKTKSLYI